ncbi:MAG: hypothetical protein ACO3MW_15635, partial [Rhodospirillales bacterium]
MLIDHMISINLLILATVKIKERKYRSTVKKQVISVLDDLGREYREVNDLIFDALYSVVEREEWTE